MMRFRPAQGLISGFAIDKDGVAYTGDGNSVSVAEPLNLSLGDSKIKIILFFCSFVSPYWIYSASLGCV